MPRYFIYYGAALPIVANGAHEIALLEFAEKFRGWHSYPDKPARLSAMHRLAARDCLHLDEAGRVYRFKYPEKTA
jgi:hypothetical protein